MSIARDGRWTADRANAWYAGKPWWIGCNYSPSTAVNTLAMWQADTFDLAVSDRELRAASAIGFNSVRVFLNQVPWESDPDGFLDRVERFLALAARHRLGVMPVLLDDCAFAGRDPVAGAQPPPVPGVHNSGWVPSHPRRWTADERAWPRLRAYVEAVVARFAGDPRIDVWDVYNEPGNGGADPAASARLVAATFSWARSRRPSQPLTCGPWRWELRELVEASFALSDVTSFHDYDDLARTTARLAALPQDRPILCTEWMARTQGSTFVTHLPLWRARRIGCWSWGLVRGATQTHLPWTWTERASEPLVWHHDLLRADGEPWSPEEVACLARHARGDAAAAASG